MALGTTNISLNAVNTAIGKSPEVDGSIHLFNVGTSNLINKWSRYKPVRGTFPESSNSKYGLNLPTNWDYLQPQGGSPGGSPDEPVRLGDFRGYEHDKDVAGPVVFVNSAGVTLSDSLIPGLAGDGYLTGSVTFNMNISDENVRITPTDLGLNNYYWGIKLVLPGGGGTYYKTNSSVLGNGWVKTISVQFNDYTVPSFVDCPYAIGEFSWSTFISSTSASTWTTSAPSNIIYLPTGTYGSKTIVNSGTFTITDWLLADDRDMSWTWGQYGIGVAINSTIYSSLARWYFRSKPAWLTYKVYDEGGTLDRTAFPEEWTNAFILKLYPTAAQDYGDPLRSGTVYLGDVSTDLEEILVSQDAAPAHYIVNVSKWIDDASALAWSSVSAYINEGTSTVVVTMNKTAGPTSIYYKVFYNGTEVNGNIITGWSNGSGSKNLSATTLADNSSEPITVVLSGDAML